MRNLPVIAPICCEPGTPAMSPETAAVVAGRFKALADPTRVAIVNRLAGASELCVCDLTDAFSLGQPTISHHLKVLREAGLVDVARRGKWAYYRIVPETIEQLGAILSPGAE
jgi:ArsR family transcriptional regulator